MRFLPWMVVVILVAYPIAYFILNWSDRTFRDGAVGNWFGTVVGVVVGVPVGMALARAQQKAQSESERLHELAVRRERQRSIAHRVYEELEYNLTLVKYLTQVLSKSPTTRGDLWDWAEKVVGGMEFEAWREFDATLLPEQRSTYASSELAYRDVKRLVSRVRESTAAHGFLFGSSANSAEANSRLGDAKNHADIVQSEIATALQDLRSED